MFGIGVPELAIILVIVLVVFGDGKLPGIGAGIGNGIKNFKMGISDPDEQPPTLENNPKNSPQS